MLAEEEDKEDKEVAEVIARKSAHSRQSSAPPDVSPPRVPIKASSSMEVNTHMTELSFDEVIDSVPSDPKFCGRPASPQSVLASGTGTLSKLRSFLHLPRLRKSSAGM